MEYNMPYRVGLIGAGRIGCEFDDCHARAYKRNPKTDLVAIFDKKFDKAVSACSKWEVPVAGDEINIAELGLNIISICTPPQTHFDILQEVLLADSRIKAIYCEKPIAIDLNEAKEMVKMCRDRKVILQVNHQRRFGTPMFTFSRGIFNTGTHMVDLLRQYFGEVKSIRIENSGSRFLIFENITIEIQELDIDKPVFEFKIPTHDLIIKGVEHLVDCLDNRHDSISNGEQAIADLEVLWKLKSLEK